MTYITWLIYHPVKAIRFLPLCKWKLCQHVFNIDLKNETGFMPYVSADAQKKEVKMMHNV